MVPRSLSVGKGAKGSEWGGSGLPRKLYLLHSYAWGWILSQQNSIQYIRAFKKEREGQRFDELRGAEGAAGIILLGKGHNTVQQPSPIRSGNLPLFQNILETQAAKLFLPTCSFCERGKSKMIYLWVC